MRNERTSTNTTEGRKPSSKWCAVRDAIVVGHQYPSKALIK
jgi:hypothetical protein